MWLRAVRRDAANLADLLEWLEQRRRPTSLHPPPAAPPDHPDSDVSAAPSAALHDDVEAGGRGEEGGGWLVDYSVRQTTLESVFLRMANAHGTPGAAPTRGAH